MAHSLSILPLKPEQLNSGIEKAVVKLISKGLSREESVLKIGYEFDEWLNGLNLQLNSSHLETLLESADWSGDNGKKKYEYYKILVAKLSTKFALTRRDSAVVLSQLPLMLSLARDFRASPARIVNLVRHPDGKTSINWRMVDLILREFGIKTELDKDKVAELIASDKEDSTRELADATIESLIETLIAQAADMGLDQSFQNGMRSIFAPRNGESFIPYLQILLYIGVIDHFFDHPPEFIYTFKPRGEVANDIFGIFPSSLAPGGNPMLNNFKAVDRLTSDWAESRDEMREQATALIEVVRGLASLAYSPRTQMSRSIRGAIVRYIEIKTPTSVHLEPQTKLEDIKIFLTNVGAVETETRGVIEQRVADFFGSFDYHQQEWRSRGLGDPVNASNSSSGKLGDCDFQNATEHRCVAIEAHAGRLTDVYVHEHLRTLHLNLPKRMKEWSHISDLSEWKLHIRFFVHQDARSGGEFKLPDSLKKFEVITYSDHLNELLPRLGTDSALAIELFNRWVIGPLNAPNTPISTKKRAKKLLEP